jgi:hypothetical protein
MATTKTRAKKFFINVKDDRFEDRRQSSVLSVLTDGNQLYTNEYGKTFTEDEIGSFDIVKRLDQAVLEFYPLDGRINEYSYGFVSYDIKQNIFDSSSYDFGSIVSVATTYKNVTSGQTTIYSIDDTFTSFKFLVEATSLENNHYEYNEINVIINNGDVYFTEYGRLTISDNQSIMDYGIGSYDVSYSNSKINLLFTPTVTEELNFNVVSVSIANTSYTTGGSRVLKFGKIISDSVSIASTSSPQPVSISTYSSDYNLNYFIVQVTDNTNNEKQLSEILVLNNDIESTIIEYGGVYSDSSSGIGTFNTSASSVVELFFTPKENTDVSISFLQHSISYSVFPSFPLSIDFKNSEITTGLSKFEYSGDISFKKDFDLKHNLIPIFERRFNGGKEFDIQTFSGGVDLGRNLVYIPNHFFVTGEKVVYRSEFFYYLLILTTNLSATAGIGTDKLSVNSTTGLRLGDYFGLVGVDGEYISVTGISGNTVSIASTIPSSINNNTEVKFYRLLDQGEQTTDTSSAINITGTVLPGIGATTKLSGDLYIYKYDDRFVGFCASAEDALDKNPTLIDFTSVGVGNNHYITATNQNAKCLILVDGVIQSPIVSTGTSSILNNELSISGTTLYFSNVNSFFSGDLIEVGDEIMKISSVGVGSTNYVEVIRSFLGTNPQTHNSSSVITKLDGNYNIIGSRIYFSEAPYGPIYDNVNGDINIRSTFQGRVFLRSGIPDGTENTYEKNYIFDDISPEFDSVSKDFDIESDGQSISGFSTSNSILLVNNIFQNPIDDYELSESSGQTQVNFTGSPTSVLYDPNNSSVPRGGIIVSVGSSPGFGYQPLVAAGGTAIVSSAGTIQSISIGNSGSGYRSGLQSIIQVGVQTLSTGTPNIEFIGTASASNGHIVSVAVTNPGFGYTASNPPLVVFDEPLSYSNLELIHTETSSGIGSQAKIDIVVGQGSSVIDFTITNFGYSYQVGDTLTIESGGISGIPTDTSKPFQNFVITVDKVYKDKFAGWSIGQLEKLDDIDELFDGNRKSFPLINGGNRFAIVPRSGSKIDVKSVLLIFINDVLQDPNTSYYLIGGSIITFTEPPKSGSKCKIFFYKGTPDIDVVDVDVLETIKPGDTVKITGNGRDLIQYERSVNDILLVDTIKTNSYNLQGVTENLELLRPIIWCKQRNDSVIDGVDVYKSRDIYESSIFPTSNIIQSVGIGSTQIFVDSLKISFDSINENVSNILNGKIEVIDTKDLKSAFASAIVSSAGTISSVLISDGGFGYTISPTVSIQNPIGIGSTGRSILQSSISSGIVTSISITNPGFGYTSSNPPIVSIEPPTISREIIDDVSYEGDFGIITGIAQTSVGLASTGLVLDLYIPQNSYLRNVLATNPIITQSQLKENYYFEVFNSNIGFGVTSLRKDNTVIGVGTTGFDNIYQVISVSSASTSVYGVGIATVTRVIVSISSYSGLSGFGNSSYYGNYSWGLIKVPSTTNSYSVNTSYGVVGLNSTPVVRRFNYLRYRDGDPI